MNVDVEQGQAEENATRVVVYLDDEPEPLFSYEPPVRFELDTSRMEDGRHQLRIEAYDDAGQKGIRIVPFTVRNGPGISVSGLKSNDVLEGRIPVLVNSYGGRHQSQWEPSRAETPAPIPTWAWVIFIVIVAFGIFYGIRQWTPPPEFASTPTYSRISNPTPSPPAVAGAPSGAAQRAPAPAPEPAPTTTQEAGADTATTGAGAAGAGTTATASGGAPQAVSGATVYANNCARCHQADGQGLPGAFPPLVGDPVVTARDPTRHIEIVLNGLKGKTIQGVSYAAAMPAFGKRLSNEEVAAVINHERTSWGNSAPTITAADVAKVRKQ